MAMTVSTSHIERAVISALSGLTVAYGSPLGTVALPVVLDDAADPVGAAAPWARLVAIDTGEISGNTGLDADGSFGDLVVTVVVTSPDSVTVQNYFALSMALDAVAAALRRDQRRTPATGQKQQVHFEKVRTGIDPNNDDTTRERTGFVVATALVSRTTD